MRYLLVLSGKGGVGKTTVAANLAALLAKKFRLGFIDIDIYAPNAHLILGLPEVPTVEERNMLIAPTIDVHGRKIQFMSMAMFLPDGVGLAIKAEFVLDIVRTIFQFTKWDCDIIVVDAPPSSLDVVNYTLELVAPRAKAILVTEPHKMSLSDLRRLHDILQLKEVEVRAIVLNKFNLFKDWMSFERSIEGFGVPIIKIEWDEELQERLKPSIFEELGAVVL